MFIIVLHKKDISILENIKSTLGVGGIYTQGSNTVQFCVSSVKDLIVLIEHFDKYPLITHKRVHYELFKQAFKLMERGEHLTFEGLHKIVAIKASLN